MQIRVATATGSRCPVPEECVARPAPAEDEEKRREDPRRGKKRPQMCRQTGACACPASSPGRRVRQDSVEDHDRDPDADAAPQPPLDGCPEIGRSLSHPFGEDSAYRSRASASPHVRPVRGSGKTAEGYPIGRPSAPPSPSYRVEGAWLLMRPAGRRRCFFADGGGGRSRCFVQMPAGAGVNGDARWRQPKYSCHCRSGCSVMDAHDFLPLCHSLLLVTEECPLPYRLTLRSQA